MNLKEKVYENKTDILNRIKLLWMLLSMLIIIGGVGFQMKLVDERNESRQANQVLKKEVRTLSQEIEKLTTKQIALQKEQKQTLKEKVLLQRSIYQLKGKVENLKKQLRTLK